jgi:hypothetical protein
MFNQVEIVQRNENQRKPQNDKSTSIKDTLCSILIAFVNNDGNKRKTIKCGRLVRQHNLKVTFSSSVSFMFRVRIESGEG